MNADGMSEAERIRLAGTFGASAESYERGRPGYPAEAIDWLLAPVSPLAKATVCDLGAGTGKLTRSLVHREVTVVAVEPSEPMLDQLRWAVPAARASLGSAEATGLDNGSMNAVLVAQAWHWVDPIRAIPEVARILTDAGVLGLLWNLRAESTDFAVRLAELMGGSDQLGWQHTDPSSLPGSPFAPGEQRQFEWIYNLSCDQLIDMVASRSYVIAMHADARTELLAQVAELASASAIDGQLEVPYQTHCVRYRRANR